MAGPLIRSVSDTARWVAFHRATESERPDAIFHDPYARRLAGDRGQQIAQLMHHNDWAIAIRTFLFDKLIRETVSRERIDMVVNLAAGLDSRPYRLELPTSLQWVEVDLPEILEDKRQLLENETPRVRLDVITQDLADANARRQLLSSLNQKAAHVLTLSEGLLIYLNEEQVMALAADLHAQPHFDFWIVEIISPAVKAWANRNFAKHLREAKAPFDFAPADWREFFARHGWQVTEFHSISENARRYNREPMPMKIGRLIGSLFPAAHAKRVKLWESGVALLRRA